MNEKRVAIFGSTGSIGTAALEVMTCLGGDWAVSALSTHSRTDLLAEQVEQHRPRVAIVSGGEVAPALRKRMEAVGTMVLTGPDHLPLIAAGADHGTVVAAVVGAAGVPLVRAAAAAGKRIALANKESLVVAGELIMPLASSSGARILPVDSEHSAIFQALACGRREDVARVILTASGGPFRTATREAMEHATSADALAHPTWKMGAKITVDSATMFNKAFELIEARWLFGLAPEQIEIVVHPQSLIHSMVEYSDGSVIAQMSPPDMRVPIQYALTFPHRLACPSRKMDWAATHEMRFEPPDRARFPAIDLAYWAAREGGTAGAVLNAANEVAVAAFLRGKIRFGGISRVVGDVVAKWRGGEPVTWESLERADGWARGEAVRTLG